MKSRISSPSGSERSDQDTNNFQALKKLKQTEEQIQIMKRRFKVLKVKDEENRAKAMHNQQKIKVYEEIKKQKQQQRQIIRKKQVERLMQTDEYKLKNKKMKQQNKDKIKQTVDLIKSDKKAENKMIREKRIQNEKKFANIRKEDVEEKKKIRDKVISQEKKQIQKINKYKHYKYVNTLNHKSIDTSNLTNQRLNKQKQLEELMKLELSLAKQHSQSLQVSDQMQNRLKQVTGHYDKKKTNLPSINSHKNSSRESNSTHL